ncbi:MAG: GLUG motif-containing protein, partial [Candidatus Omnitrophota bacterium]
SYSSFNINSNESVIVILPSSASDILNRVTGPGASNIYGSLSCNGIFILVNPSGVNIGSTANISAAGLVISTRDIANADFINGDYVFRKLSQQELDMLIINEGAITLQNGGFGVLIAGAIENKGTIVAPLGKIALASGDAVRLDISNGGLVSVAIEEKVASTIKDSLGNPITDQIKNTGTLDAPGGVVLLEAESLTDIFTKAINLEGHVQANTFEEHDGLIRLVADGDIESYASLQAKGGSINIETEGAVKSLGSIETGYLIEKGASCLLGGTTIVGTAYLENADGAVDVEGNISGNYEDNGDVRFTGNVTLIGATTLRADLNGDDSGKIDMQTYALIGGNYDLTLYTGEAATLNSITGVNTLTLNSSNTSDKTYTSPGTENFSITTMKTNYHSIFSRDKTEDGYTMIYSTGTATGGLQWIDNAARLGGTYKLANNIDASETASWNSGLGFNPIGDATNKFTGTFDGNSKTISGIAITRTGANYIGLFGYTGTTAQINNTGLTDVNVAGNNFVGALVGLNDYCSISNSYATGSVSGSNNVGGLIGYNFYGPISNSYATGSVSGSNNNVGGLAGNSNGSISNSYATGSVSGNESIGGLVGNAFGGSISDSYAIGTVSGDSGFTGGFVGYNNTGAYNGYNYWSTSNNIAGLPGIGNDTKTNVIGGTNAALMTTSTGSFSGWDFDSTWAIVLGETFPYLQYQYPTTPPNGISGTAYTDNGTTGIAQNTDIIIAKDGAELDTLSAYYGGFFYQTYDSTAFTSGDTVMAYISNGQTNIGNTVTVIGSSGTAGLDIYGNSTLRITNDNGLVTSNANLGSARVTGDPNNMVYSFDSGTLSVDGSIYIASNKTFAPGGDINLSGDWTNAGTFTHSSKQVTFNDATQVSHIYGTTSFYDLTCTTAGKELQFEAGATETIVGTLTLTGAAGNLVKLRSTSSGTQWKIDPQGANNISFVDVKDSNNIRGSYINPANSVDSGNNTNWFSPPEPTPPEPPEPPLPPDPTPENPEPKEPKIDEGDDADGGPSWDRANKYEKPYLPGKYRTVVIVFEGKVVVAPYDEKGPRYDEGIVLTEGGKALQEGEIM